MKSLDVVYCTDSRYSRIMTISIISLCENNKGLSNINIYCFEKGLKDDEKNEIDKIVKQYNRNITFISIIDVCEKMRFWQPEMDLMFARFLIPYILNVKKVLYLDCDTIIISSLNELWKSSIDGYAHLVVLDTARLDAKQEASLEIDDQYFNSGVMLINCAEWNNKKIFEKMKDYESKQNRTAIFPDQRPLNAVTLKYSKIISPRYNLTSEMVRYSYEDILKIIQSKNYYNKEDYKKARSNPSIIHFSGRSIDRPWFTNCNNKYRALYREYMSKFEFTNFNLWHDSLANVVKWKIKYHLPNGIQIILMNASSKMRSLLKR